MTGIERAFERVVDLRPEMSDRIVLARLAAAILFLPAVLPIKLWRVLTWTRPS